MCCSQDFCEENVILLVNGLKDKKKFCKLTMSNNAVDECQQLLCASMSNSELEKQDSSLGQVTWRSASSIFCGQRMLTKLKPNHIELVYESYALRDKMLATKKLRNSPLLIKKTTKKQPINILSAEIQMTMFIWMQAGLGNVRFRNETIHEVVGIKESLREDKGGFIMLQRKSMETTSMGKVDEIPIKARGGENPN